MVHKPIRVSLLCNYNPHLVKLGGCQVYGQCFEGIAFRGQLKQMIIIDHLIVNICIKLIAL